MTLKNLAVFAILAMPHICFAADIIPGSLSSSTQNESLRKLLLSIPSNDPKENAMELNKKLKSMGLPTIDVESPTFKLQIATSTGFAGGQTVGAAFYDGKNRFCLPCTVGMNSFEWGITPFKINPPNRMGDFYGALECLSAIPSFAGVQVSNQIISGTHFATVVGSSDDAKGFYIFTDDKVNFYKANVLKDPDNFFESYRVTLPDNTESAVLFRREPDSQGKPDLHTLETGEIWRKIAESDKSPDLKSGQGSKRTDETIRELFAAIESKFNAVRVGRDGGAEDMCAAITTCSQVKSLNGQKLDLSQFNTKYSCSAQSKAPVSPSKSR